MKKQVSLAGIILGALMPCAAFAEGIYIYGALGQAKAEDTQSINAIDLDDTGSASRFGIGYSVTENLALEAGYAKAGKVTATLNQNLTGTIFGKSATVNSGSGYSLEGDGYTLGGKLSLPLNDDLSLTARGGLYFWEANYEVFGAGTYDGQSLSGSVSGKYDDGTANYYGAGAAYKLSDQFAITFDYTSFTFDIQGVDQDASVYELGLTYSFE